jgi:hypothetical protein
MASDIRRRRPRDYALACEAALHLAAARIALGVVPFHVMVQFCTRGVRGGALSGGARDQAIRDVRWAVAAAAARLPGDTVCLPRALCANVMLRRRRVPATLTYGARTRRGRLEAHVWLTAGGVGVVGHEVAPEYSALATYATLARPGVTEAS